MRVLLIIMTLALVGLQYRLWSGENGYAEVRRLEVQIAEQSDNNLDLEQRNQMLREEIADLRNGLESVEERARNELGMVGSDEQFFRVIKRPSSNAGQ
ncbi:cell division protein FtsB [Ferrimonas sediminum]|uniref:Cell division protein FtsB n=1 Tax=Ferrimonas sediminum TaxID=718193 RepID=A0A1G8PNN0_9GAMM|nr:cell division protein FtsB [Ferrimonas sediminum]SDI93440.1 cell division protein FtsB [Ferrimonas sediminum]